MSAILYKVTVLSPVPPSMTERPYDMIERTYHMTSGTEAKAVMAYAQSKGLDCTVTFSRHDDETTARADIDRELRLAANHVHA